MPGMSKAVQKYKDDKNVKFLFVDTWENVDDKLANAKSFMTKKGFPFYVLMDTEDKMVTDFKVSGIPTKFVLDKAGKIRFKAVGFNGNDDELVDEISTMIAVSYTHLDVYKRQEWNNQLPVAAAAMNNNNIAWRMAEKDEHIEEAKKMAQQASTWAKAEISNPTQKKPCLLYTSRCV